MGKLTPELDAYNAAVEALNYYDERVADLLERRDRSWRAADAICGSKQHGQARLPRNPGIKNGELRSA